MAATPQLYDKKYIVNGCKSVQVAGNDVTMCGFPWGNGTLLWQWILAKMERAGTRRKRVTRSMLKQCCPLFDTHVSI